MKKIGVLTSGGNSQGMNAAICGVVKKASSMNIDTYIIHNGFKGLFNNKIKLLSKKEIQKIRIINDYPIGSARFPEFENSKIRVKAIENLKKKGIEALIVIGGDGSYRGALALTRMGVNCIGLPGTIDNDIASSELTIGFDTTINIVVDAVDRLRDTMTWHHRCCIVEVMGNEAVDIAVYGGIAANANLILTKENKMSEEDIVQFVKEKYKQRYDSVIIIIVEKLYKDIHIISELLNKKTKFETKATILGHIQRGGKPSARDRFNGFMMGATAVGLLSENKGGYCMGTKGEDIIYTPIEESLKLRRPSRAKLLKFYQDINILNKEVK